MGTGLFPSHTEITKSRLEESTLLLCHKSCTEPNAGLVLLEAETPNNKDV